MEKSKTLDKPLGKPPTRLGRGLSALIPPSAVAPSPAPPAPTERARRGGEAPEGVSEIALADIRTNPNQPRTVFNRAAIDELAASVRTHGVLQPVMVRPRGGGGYELVAGERRYRAAQEAGLTRIPAVVRSLTDEESLTVALIENIQREDLNPIEAARGYKQLMDEYGLTQTQLGEQIGKKQSTISNTMRLLKLSPEMQESITNGRLSLEHGKTLLGVEDAATRLALWRDFLDLNLNRKDARDHAKMAKSLTSAPRRPSVKDADHRALEERLKSAFGMKVTVTLGKKGAGTLSMKFADTEALETLLEKLHA